MSKEVLHCKRNRAQLRLHVRPATTGEGIHRGQGRTEDLEPLRRIARYASQGMTICPLGDAFCGPISSFLDHFGHEFEEAIAKAGKMPPKALPILPLTSDRALFGMD